MKPTIEGVELTIASVVLSGFSPLDRQRILSALHRELELRLAGKDVLAALVESRSIDQLDAGQIIVRAGMSAEKTAIGIAEALIRGFGQPASLVSSNRVGPNP